MEHRATQHEMSCRAEYHLSLRKTMYCEDRVTGRVCCTSVSQRVELNPLVGLQVRWVGLDFFKIRHLMIM
jgi:hypothetical protein